MKIALCQFDMHWNDRAVNKEKIAAMMKTCQKQFDWIIFPEMTLSGFTMNTAAAEVDAADMKFFADMAAQRGAAVSYGAVTKGENKLYTVDKTGKMLSDYSKIHLYAFGGENKYYKAGDKQQTFGLGGMSITPAVCFDLRFPYLFWNKQETTDLYVNIASWPARRAEHWMTLLRARAIETQSYMIGVNRIGKDGDGLEFSGNSMIFDPLGKVVLDCKSDEGVFVSEIDVNKELVDKTRTRFPFYKERRPTAYT